MLPARSRLRRSAEFGSAVRRGARAGRTTLVIHLEVGEPTLPPRAGFVVSRAVGPAVVRNRVRRRLRHLVAARLGGLPAGGRLVVRALPAAAGASSAVLAADLDAALSRVLRARTRPASEAGA